MRKKLPAAVQPFLFSFKSDSRSSRATSEDIYLSTSDGASPDASSSVYSPDSGTLDEIEAPIPREGSNPEMQLVPSRGESPKLHQPAKISTFSFLSSLQFASIPRPLHTPLSSLNPEHLQISETTSSELDLSLCVSHVVPSRRGS